MGTYMIIHLDTYYSYSSTGDLEIYLIIMPCILKLLGMNFLSCLDTLL